MANFISYSTVEHYCRPHLTNTYFQNTLLIQVESDSLLALRGKPMITRDTALSITRVLLTRFLMYILTSAQEKELLSDPDLVADAVRRVWLADLSFIGVTLKYPADPQVTRLLECIKQASFKKYCMFINQMDLHNMTQQTQQNIDLAQHIVSHKEYNIYDLCKYTQTGVFRFMALTQAQSKNSFDVFHALLILAPKRKRTLHLKFVDTMMGPRTCCFLRSAVGCTTAFKATFKASSWYSTQQAMQGIACMFPPELRKQVEDKPFDLYYYTITYKPGKSIVYKMYDKEISYDTIYVSFDTL